MKNRRRCGPARFSGRRRARPTAREPATAPAAMLSVRRPRGTPRSGVRRAPISGTAAARAPGGMSVRSIRSFADAAAIGTPGPPNGQPLPSVTSMRRPSSCAVVGHEAEGLEELVRQERQRADAVRLVVERQRVHRLDFERRRCRPPSSRASRARAPRASPTDRTTTSASSVPRCPVVSRTRAGVPRWSRARSTPRSGAERSAGRRRPTRKRAGRRDRACTPQRGTTHLGQPHGAILARWGARADHSPQGAAALEAGMGSAVTTGPLRRARAASGRDHDRESRGTPPGRPGCAAAPRPPAS